MSKIFQLDDVGEEIKKLNPVNSICNGINKESSEIVEIAEYNIKNEKDSDIKPSAKLSIYDFEIRGVLGTGGFGKVFMVARLTGKEKGKIYAMKVLKKAALVRNKETKELEREINVHAKTEKDVLKSIQHPFIVDFYHAFKAGGKVYLVMEYLAGGELFMQLQNERMLMEDTAIFYLSQILLAVAHLHDAGIIYRDLKPENIMLDRQGHVKLTDFGCIKEALDDEVPILHDEITYTFCGTVEYMAPEMLNRSGHGKEVDWWSFGILTHDMLTGAPPFTGTNRKIITERVCKSKLQPKKYLTPDAQDLLRKLLNKKPELRLGSGGAEDIKNHRFFGKVDWEAVLSRKTKPPFTPVLKSEDDCSNFDSEFTSKPAIDSPPGCLPSPSVEDVFLGFSYNREDDL